MFLAHTKAWNQTSDLVQLTDLTSDGVWEWFPSVDFEFMSERFWAILGYDHKEMDESPMAWLNLIHPDDKQSTLDMYEKHVHSKGDVPYHATVRYRHKDGHEVFVLCRGSVVDWLPDGKPWRVLGTHTDVTDIVKRDAVQAQSVFIARMSHEIRSPLCSILNECELLGKSGGNTGVIVQTCQQLVSLCDDILQLGKSTGSYAKLKREPTELHALLMSCLKRHRLQAKKKGIRIRLVSEDLPDTVLVDPVKFNQVVDNLLNNAIKYSEHGAISMDVEYCAEKEVCELRIIDEGAGISHSTRTKMFDDFVQGDATMQGAGIGLAVARKLARLMNGDVVVERSEVGKGTTMLFTAVLPVADDLPRRKSSSIRVLVVDDMATNRAILKRRLDCTEKLGLTISELVEAVNGRDALEAFTACKGDFQLILMDCLMPILDGYDATSSIHAECEKLGMEPVPVVAVTASVCPDVREKCLQHGMKFVVTKPYTEDDLLLSIQTCLKN